MSAAKNGPLKVGLVGCGRIAQTHLEALRQVDGLTLCGVSDVRGKVARSVGEQYDTATYSDHHALLEGARPDAVIVCTPPNSHPEIAGHFLDNGVHVLCEKPLAIAFDDAKSLVEKAVKAGRVMMMASKFRYVDDVIKAKGIVESGILGDVILFENVFCAKVDMKERWNSNRAIGGGGVLIDNGTHSIDIARYLLGPIAKVQAEEGRRVQGLDVEDTCRLSFRTESRAMGVVDLSWSIFKERDSYVEIFGSDGVLSIGWKGSKYRQSEKLDWIEFGHGYDKLSAFARQLRNFAGTILGREAPLITAEDGLESVRVIEAAYRSMQMDTWIPMADDDRVTAS